MPPERTTPGIFVEEISSGVRPIDSVSTSVTAFIGFLKRGPMDRVQQVGSFGEFERIFGGLDAECELGYAVQQFFLNGGTQALIIRVASYPPTPLPDSQNGTASVTLLDDSGAPVLEVQAYNPGEWGNRLQVDVDFDRVVSSRSFNMKLTGYELRGGIEEAVAVESFNNLGMDAGAAGYAVNEVNAGSRLVQLAAPDVATHDETTHRPVQTGTTSSLDINAINRDNLNGLISVLVVANGNDLFSGNFNLVTGTDITPSQLRSELQLALRTISGLEQATVQLVDERLRIRPGVSNNNSIISFSGTLARKLGLAGAGVVENVQAYSPVVGETTGFQAAGAPGSDGLQPGADDLIGSDSHKTGMYALDEVDLFNILCIPRMAFLNTAECIHLITQATQYCARRSAFLIMDTPDELRTVNEVRRWITENDTLRSKYAAAYFPRVMIADPLDSHDLKTRPVSGTIAGVIARTDDHRGVWKAPAGPGATLLGVQAFEHELTDNENGILNPLAINVLKTVPGMGKVSWGARTLDGSDQRGSAWKYIPVVRTYLFIEQSLQRGLKWAVFEPNAEPLWANIRLNVGAFMQDLFRKGAFQGVSPDEAYFVRCDTETTTQNDINLGIVNIVVGFAPLKPAEFVVVRIKQKTAS